MRHERRIARALRKQALLQQSRRLREKLAQQAQPLTPWFHGIDRLRAGLRWLAARPAIPVAMLTALLVARPRAVVRWLARGVGAWQLYRQLHAPSTMAATGAGAGLLERLLGQLLGRGR